MAIRALATAPSRATSTIHLSFGVMTIPLSVYTGVESTRVERREFLNGDTNVSVGRSPIRKDTGEVVDNADVVRMAEAQSGAWVPLTDDEIAAATTERGLAEIVCFVHNRNVGQYLVEDVKQVRPKKVKGKAMPGAAKAFSVLLQAMQARKVHALVYVAMRGPARYALLSASGDLYLIHSADQVRQPVDHESAEVTERETALAATLIDAVGIDTPTLLDTTAQAVQTFVNNKAVGVTPPPPSEAPVIVDVMAELEASILAMKKEETA